jgi:hypothetical protein
MQGYITAAGDTVTCAPQPVADHYICLLPDGTDIAKVALVNGAARVAPDAPDSYRVQQLDALTNRRGYWATAPQAAVAAALIPLEAQPQYAFVAGDDGADGITYVGGEPMAMIDGEAVFFALGAAGLGWGYYDHFHHWHGAPDRFRAHLDHFHPDGRGLRGYDHGLREAAFRGREEAFRRDEFLRGREAMVRRDEMLHGREAMVRHDEALRGREDIARREEAVHGREAAFRPPEARPGEFRPGEVRGGEFHPGAVRPGEPLGARPGNVQLAGARPGFAPPAGGLRPAPAPGAAVAAGFHPPAAPAAAFHAPAAAPHVAAAVSAVKKK